MLLSGINHVAVLTADTERFLEFYGGVFGATHEVFQERDGFKLTLVWVGPTSELNVFELADNTEHARQVPMFGRGRLDHLWKLRRSTRSRRSGSGCSRAA